MTLPELKEAFVISVTPGKVKIEVNTEIIENWSNVEKLKVGSYLKITDNDGIDLIAIIENFNITLKDIKTTNNKGIESIKEEKIYIIEAMPLGTIEDDKFIRGGNEVTIPPKGALPASKDDILKIYNSGIKDKAKFSFSKLVQDETIDVIIDGNKFFNKHFAIVGSTGSGKSHTLAKVLQTAIDSKNDGITGINNSHIVLFDIHGEYESAFENPNCINAENLVLPYWLLNGDELEELFLESGDFNNYNQSSILRNLITQNKKRSNPTYTDNIYFDSPLKFNLKEILYSLINLSSETINMKADKYMIIDSSYSLIDGKTTVDSGITLSKEEKMNRYFESIVEFHPTKGSNIKKGDHADGSLSKFISRLENKMSDKRLEFLLGEKSKNITFQETLKQFLGYQDGEGESKANITIIDLSGVPFDVLSITVSLISRLLFEYGYFYKRMQEGNSKEMDNPLLLVYEEAHKYVPKNGGAKYNSVKNSIERISKEGRKYGVTLGIITQRPSEVSETIFSQCSNFISMRLTNPDDQTYVKRLLPDSLGGLVDSLSTLKSGEAILMGDSVIMPSLVKINKCDENLKPSSNDIDYLELWKGNWKDLDFGDLESEFKK